MMCCVPWDGESARHGGHFEPLSKSRAGDWPHLLSNKKYSSLSCFHTLPKAPPENFIIYCCSSHVVFDAEQEPKMLIAVCEIYMKMVSGSFIF